MANQKLINYIQDLLRKGYNINSIRLNLNKYGYNPTEIEEAIKNVYVPKKEKPQLKIIMIVLGIVIILLGAIAVISLISKTGKKEVELNLNTELLSKRIIPGGYVMFNIDIEKEGPGLIEITHEINDPSGKTIETLSERISKSKASQFKLPADTKPGTYTIKTTANLGEITKTSIVTFSMGEIETEECPFSCDDLNKCTKDYCSEETGFKCVNAQITPCCGNDICETNEDCPEDCITGEEIKEEPIEEDEFESLTIWERVEAIKDIAKDSPLKAKEYCGDIGVANHKNQCYYNIGAETGSVEYCNLITDEKIIDRCFTKIAEMSNNSRICESISTESRRDNCYMVFVQREDYTICDKLINKYYKESCESLKIMASLPEYKQYQVE